MLRKKFKLSHISVISDSSLSLQVKIWTRVTTPRSSSVKSISSTLRHTRCSKP